MANEGSSEGDTEEEDDAELRSLLVCYCSKQQSQQFQWTEAGRNGVTILRQYLYLQDAYKARERPSCTISVSGGGTAAGGTMQKGLPGLTEGHLARTVSSFLTVVWSDLRSMVCKELKRVAEAMRLHADASLEGEQLHAALLHVSRRLSVWIALDGAPCGLLGSLNEVHVAALAPEPLAALWSALSLLLESCLAALAQLGSGLASLLLGMAEPCQGPDTELDSGQCAAWLSSWRVYAALHQRALAWLKTHQVAPWGEQHLYAGAPPVALPLLRRLLGHATPSQHAGPGGASTFTTANAEGAAPRAPAFVDADIGDSNAQCSALGGPVLPEPRTLLAQFTSMHADYALRTLLPYLENPSRPAPCDPLVGSSILLGGEQGQRANERLGQHCSRLTLQLQGVQDANASLEGLQGSGDQDAMVALLALPPNRRAFSSPHGSAPSSVNNDPCVGNGSVSQLKMLNALAPLLSPDRLARLRCNASQLALQYHDVVLAARSAVRPLLARGAEAGGPDGPAPKRILGVALAESTCLFLHRLHRQLASRYCASRLSAPLELPSVARVRQHGGASVASTVAAPAIAVMRLPSCASSVRAGATVAALGAAAMAADGAPVAVDAKAAASSVAFARALAAVRGPAAGVSAGGGAAATATATAAITAAELTAAPSLAEAMGQDGDESAQGQRAGAWARLLECRAGALASAASCMPNGVLATDKGALVSALQVTSGCSDGDRAGVTPGDPISLLHAVLCLACGRVCLLADSSAARRGIHCSNLPWDLQPPPPQQDSANRDGDQRPDIASGAAFPNGAQGFTPMVPSPSLPVPSGVALAAAASLKLQVLQLAVASCAIAVNALAHVRNTHTPGPSADLPALCSAHCRAVALGLAVEQLLAVLRALDVHTWGWLEVAAPLTEAAAPHAPVVVSPAVGVALSKMRDGSTEERDLRRWPVESRPPAANPSALVAFPRLPCKLKWRRSLRRVLPSWVGLGPAAVEGKAARVDTAAVALRPAAPAAAAHRAANGRGCWAEDPLEPSPMLSADVPSKPPPQQCPTYLETWKAMEALSAGRQEASGAKQAAPLLCMAATAAVSVAGPTGDSCAKARGSTNASRPLSGPVMPSSTAEASLVALLQALRKRLGDCAASAEELLVAEMRQRASALCRQAAENGGPGGGGGRDAPAAAVQLLVEKLLRPLREALCKLHPAGQPQLLHAAWCAVVDALHEHLRARGRAGAEQARRGLDLLQQEAEAALRQLEQAGDEGAAGVGVGVGREATFRSALGVAASRSAEAARREIESKLRFLRGEEMS